MAQAHMSVGHPCRSKQSVTQTAHYQVYGVPRPAQHSKVYTRHLQKDDRTPSTTPPHIHRIDWLPGWSTFMIAS